MSIARFRNRLLNDFLGIACGQYDELGMLMITVVLLGLVLPIITVLILNPLNSRKK